MNLVHQPKTLIGGREESACSAGKITNPNRRKGIGITPIRACQGCVDRQGQARQKRSAGWPCVIGRKKLPISNQPLEDHASQIVGLSDTPNNKLLCRLPERFQYGCGRLRWQDANNLTSRVKDRPVVDFKDQIPFIEN